MLNLLLKVPLISSILIFLRPESVFRTLVNTSFFIFGTIFIFQRFLPFQYGKTYTKGKAYLRLEIPDRIAFLFVHSSAPIIFLYSYFIMQIHVLLNSIIMLIMSNTYIMMQLHNHQIIFIRQIILKKILTAI